MTDTLSQFGFVICLADLSVPCPHYLHNNVHHPEWTLWRIWLPPKFLLHLSCEKMGRPEWIPLGKQKRVHTRSGHAQLFFESAIVIPQLDGNTSAIAIPQLLKKCCSTTATPQFCNSNFSEVRNFKSVTWELHFRNFRHVFGCGVAWIYHWDDLKGTVARDFIPLFFVNQPHLNPWVIL